VLEFYVRAVFHACRRCSTPEHCTVIYTNISVLSPSTGHMLSEMHLLLSRQSITCVKMQSDVTIQTRYHHLPDLLFRDLPSSQCHSYGFPSYSSGMSLLSFFFYSSLNSGSLYAFKHETSIFHHLRPPSLHASVTFAALLLQGLAPNSAKVILPPLRIHDRFKGRL
jgi:hypothetical protein